MTETKLKEMLKRWHEHCQYIQEKTSIGFSESSSDKEKRKQQAKRDYDYFVEYYFPHFTYDAHQDRTIHNASFHTQWANRVKANIKFAGVAEWPREHAKSTHNTIFIPLWLKINGELDGMMLGGKSEDDAIRLLGDVQAELQYNQRFIDDWGEQFNEGDWTSGDFTCKDGTYFVALGRGQSPRGLRKGAKRPNLGVIDDIDDDEIVLNQVRVVKVLEWILGAFIGALDIRRSRFLMSGNRIHPKSILAHFVGDVEDGDPKREGIYHSRIVATTNGELTGQPVWKEKYTAADLHQRFKLVGTQMALREYFHKYELLGKRFKAEWIRWDKIPRLQEFDNIVAYIDPSWKPKTSNDYKAVRIWGNVGLKKYLIACYVRQTTITNVVHWLYDYHESLPSNVTVEYFIEGGFNQSDFMDDFDLEGEVRGYILPIRSDDRDKPDKFARIDATTVYYERGQVIYNEKERRNPDFQTGLLQLLGFEKGSAIHDDAPDADEGAFHIIHKRSRLRKFKSSIGKRINPKQW